LSLTCMECGILYVLKAFINRKGYFKELDGYESIKNMTKIESIS